MSAPRLNILDRLDSVPYRFGVPIVMIVAIIPYLLRGGGGFSSDDWLLLASVQNDGGVFESLWTHLTQAYFGTWIFNLYMPLYSWSVSLEARIFGADPTGYFIVNIACFSISVALAYLAGARLVGRATALMGALLLAVNPWTANNVSWMVGRCSTVSAAFIFGGILLYFRWRDGGERRFPLGLLVCILLGVFYRQTTLFLPIFIALIDVFDGKVSVRRVRLWAVLGSPVLLYMVVCYGVLGAWGPNYALVRAVAGNIDAASPGFLTQLTATTRDLLLPAMSDEPARFDTLRWVMLGLISVIIVLGIRRLLDGKSRHRLLLSMIVVHGAPLFWGAGWMIQGESAQRWIVVSWIMMLFVVEFMRRCLMPTVGVACVAALVVASGIRLDQNLEGYAHAAHMTEVIRDAIADAPEEIVFVNNIEASLGPSPFFGFGLGATQLPPFSAQGKRVYPIMSRAIYRTDALSQVPIGCVLPEYGTPCSTLFVDYDGGRVVNVSEASQLGERSIFDQIPRLDVLSPQRGATAEDSLKLRLDALGAERIDVHFLTPTSHVYFHRVRGQSYEFGRFLSDGSYEEDLWPELQMGTFQSGAAMGRCYLWVLLYEKADVHSPMAASEFIEINSTAQQKKRHW